jgi:hypothetical protein
MIKGHGALLVGEARDQETLRRGERHDAVFRASLRRYEPDQVTARDMFPR